MGVSRPSLKLLVLWWCFVSGSATTIDQKLKEDLDLSQFLTMLERSDTINMTLNTRPATIFAPINEAFQKASYDKALDNDDRLVKYHMLNLPMKTDQLRSYVTSDLEGNPPLWITHKSGAYENAVYVNNARILVGQSNVQAKNTRNMEQILHKIDEVLVPVVTRNKGQVDLYCPNAWEYIENHESWVNIKNHRIRLFKERIKAHKKQDIFKNDGAHTFFIPVDEGFKNPKEPSVDAKVIDGHVIPKRVLFTSPTEKGEHFETLANSDNIKVFISFSEETEGKSTIIYVKSHTLIGDKKGVVIAAIKEANIPVKNGVIHLIHKPLMVVDQTVKQFLQLNKEKEDGPLSKFCQEIVDSEILHKEFMNTIDRANQVTLFAPTNAAWDESNVQTLLKDRTKIQEVLNMHLVVDEAVYIDKIVNKQVVQIGTYNSKKNLFFSVVQNNHNRTIMVEGGGVTANIVQPDIAASNGVIHIIDRVLGLPYTTIFDKLKHDVTLNDTYELGARTRFNEQLNDTSKRFTYFVPSAKAWNQARLDLPSAIKKVFMKEFVYQAEQVLERHLVVDEEPYTMQKLKSMGNLTKGVDLRTIRDNLTLSVEEQNNNSFIIHWQGKKIQVFRPNIECTNGIIHVIDYPFIDKGDIVVSKATVSSIGPHLLTILATKWLLL